MRRIPASSDLDFGPGSSSSSKQARPEELKLCPVRGCKFLIPAKARSCSEHKNLMSEWEAARRRNHPRNLIYRDPRWRACRMFVIERDGYTCVQCGYFDPTGRTLAADHVNEGGVMAAFDPFDPNICVTRCWVCSGKKDGARGRTPTA